MNRRPTLLAAITLTAAAALTLSGCGSDDSASSDKDKIAGADTGSETSAPPSPSESGSADRPKITFPSDAKNVFEYRKTGNATKDAVLADSTLSVNSVDEAIFKGSTDTKALGFYNTGKALESSITFVKRYIDGGDTWVGVTRYFDYKVTLSGDDKAYVSYCSDESKSYIKNRKTGKVDRSPATADSYVLYNTSLTKNDEGVWQTTNIASNGGDKACQP
ncbi:lipoprotein [Streptomyces deserti]